MVRDGLPGLDPVWRDGLCRIEGVASEGAGMRPTMQEEADYQLRQIEAMRKYGNRNVPKIIREWRALANLCRAEGTPAIQDALDKVEQHIDYAYGAQAEGRG